MDYFKHDINASEDDKICELLATGGYELLGYYWRFVEYLYSRGGKVNKGKLKGVAWSLHMDVDKLLSLINDYALFLQEDDIVYSKRILSEVGEFEAVGKRMSEIGKAGGKASAQARANRTVNRMVENVEADAQQNKRKENKENKENKINKRDSNIPPVVTQGDTITHTHTKKFFGEFQNVKLTHEEYEQLKKDFLDKADKAIKFLDEYIEEKDYKSKNHNLAIRRWVIDAIDEKSKKENKISAKNDSEFDFTLDDLFEKPDLNTSGGENE